MVRSTIVDYLLFVEMVSSLIYSMQNSGLHRLGSGATKVPAILCRSFRWMSAPGRHYMRCKRCEIHGLVLDGIMGDEAEVIRCISLSGYSDTN